MESPPLTAPAMLLGARHELLDHLVGHLVRVRVSVRVRVR